MKLFLFFLALIVAVFFAVHEAVILVQIYLGFQWNMAIIVVWGALIASWVWCETKVLRG
jgi:hypothetical protein